MSLLPKVKLPLLREEQRRCGRVQYTLGDSASSEERHHGAAGGWGGCEYEL